MPYKDKKQTIANVKKWRLANKERVLATDRARYLKNRERNIARQKKWRESHRTLDRASKLRWYYKNKDKSAKYRQGHKKEYNENKRKWAHNHREHLALKRSQQRAKLRAQGADLTLSQWNAIKRAYHFRCAYCGSKPQRLEKDHVIPIAKGGATTASNIVPACPKCNRQKSINEPNKIPSTRLLL